MKYPQAYIDYLLYFHVERDFFECHEVLEEYWKSEAGAKEQVWVGFIQLAVALYHYRRKNYKGAERMLISSQQLFTKETSKIHDLGVDSDQLLKDLPNIKKDIEEKAPYQDYNIPINNEELLRVCRNHCTKKELQWGAPSDLNNHYLINKHSLRNRADVINERARQQQIKKRFKAN
ncbi:DUF309 domain-containing protein [Alkalihalobacterium alkalinitrilicum]|uniref:DUF309 domain-containing protein n=1 Tax=Alkalihalobacterium alkalinitrilicum TaxID=427920 RepID=UPI0009953712|nr:DUF309 domain-containing protein [Alkalihalobacterium alkalinitrilicum]